jgi:DNA-binding transcriptional LysR family regulator
VRSVSRVVSSGAVPTPGQLRAFVAVAQELHFGRAARRLDISASSLSETVGRLEATLDKTLISRTSRHVALTRHGEALLPRALDILKRLESLHAIDGFDEQGPTTLRVGIGGAGFGELTRPILSRFHARHPDVQLRLREVGGSSIQAFLDSSCDLTMLHLPVEHERVVAHPIASEPRLMLMPADHPAAQQDTPALHAFRHDAFIAVAPGAPSIRDYWLAVPERHGERPRVGAVALSVADVVHQVRGLGLVMVGPKSLADVVSLPGIVARELTDLGAAEMAVVTRAGDENPLLAEFVEVTRQVTRGRPSGRAEPAGDELRAGATDERAFSAASRTAAG